MIPPVFVAGNHFVSLQRKQPFPYGKNVIFFNCFIGGAQICHSWSIFIGTRMTVWKHRLGCCQLFKHSWIRWLTFSLGCSTTMTILRRLATQVRNWQNRGRYSIKYRSDCDNGLKLEERSKARNDELERVLWKLESFYGLLDQVSIDIKDASNKEVKFKAVSVDVNVIRQQQAEFKLWTDVFI